MDYSTQKSKIGAVIVLYNPDVALLERCIDSLATQVEELCIIDNSENAHDSILNKQNIKIKYIPLRKNVGIAAAQNIGIRYFVERDYNFILFCDQDSVSPKGLVDELFGMFLLLSVKYDISAIGPLPLNRKTGEPYIYKQDILAEKKEDGYEYCIMRNIISSYSLIPIENFKDVGLMEESLFIDFVDYEWCWRANYYKCKICILVPSVSISHELGVSVSFCGWRISVSSPFRIYYQTRNLILLSRKKYVPFCWKKKNLIKLIPKIVYYSLFPENRISYIRRIYKGVFDGFNMYFDGKYNKIEK